MGRTDEALKWAEKEHQAKLERALHPSPAARTKPPRRSWNHLTMEGYVHLKTNLLTRYPNGSVKTVLFAGTAPGDGVSTTALNFAATLARDPQLKILLIDANLRTPSLHMVFKIDRSLGLSDLVVQNGCGTPIAVGPENLHFIPCGRHHNEPVTVFQSNEFDQFLKVMKESYDYVILDGPPVHGFQECRVLCAKVDGVILVIESGKTRRQVALRAKKQLEEAAGKLLGVVLNQRKYYIPEFVYRWL
ncbi:MAG TPA: CpsD/CapB family tyrosine-protein kinase [Nitrospiraceae bacterium]|nr:CpsD/CapB family tyrosine-protein kinase [Nitrospiraceae bacterium]